MSIKIFKISSIYKQYHRKEIFTKQGLWGLIYGTITDSQLEAAWKAISRLTKKTCKIWIRIKCRTPKIKKVIRSRMGKVIGSFDKYISNVKRGTVISEILFSTIVFNLILKRSSTIASRKLGVSSKIHIKIYDFYNQII